jgi:hypothetical protein
MEFQAGGDTRRTLLDTQTFTSRAQNLRFSWTDVFGTLAQSVGVFPRPESSSGCRRLKATGDETSGFGVISEGEELQ